MTLRFLIDESTGHAVAMHLRQHGYDALAVSDVMPQADDDSILRFAVTERRVLITNDKDFGEIVYRRRQQHCGILLLRLADVSAVAKKRAALSAIEQYGEQLIDAFCVATEQKSRLR